MRRPYRHVPRAELEKLYLEAVSKYQWLTMHYHNTLRGTFKKLIRAYERELTMRAKEAKSDSYSHSEVL